MSNEKTTKEKGGLLHSPLETGASETHCRVLRIRMLIGGIGMHNPFRPFRVYSLGFRFESLEFRV